MARWRAVGHVQEVFILKIDLKSQMNTEIRKAKPKLFRGLIGTIRSRSAEDIRFVGKVDLQIRKFTKRNRGDSTGTMSGNRKDSTGTMSCDKNNNIKFPNHSKNSYKRRGDSSMETDRSNNSTPCPVDKKRFVHFCIEMKIQNFDS